MPYADPERKKRYMKEYRRQLMDSGYGKVLYARRKLRYDNEVAYREAIDDALIYLGEGLLESAEKRLAEAVKDAEKRKSRTP